MNSMVRMSQDRKPVDRANGQLQMLTTFVSESNPATIALLGGIEAHPSAKIGQLHLMV